MMQTVQHINIWHVNSDEWQMSIIASHGPLMYQCTFESFAVLDLCPERYSENINGVT